ncbi:hypothetical protein VNO80_18631 [Phaseolus coccineus]|uniref:RING-type domain-containing protein n=1 Tax=Phaseolus coccineus TaxID=3886 RepID=A0AAN9MEQ7_PHACN
MIKGYHYFTLKFVHPLKKSKKLRFYILPLKYPSRIDLLQAHQLNWNTLSPSMEGEEGKQCSHKNPYVELEEVDFDFILALSMQEQQRDFTMLSTIESESDEYLTDSSIENDDDGDPDFVESQEFDTDLQFLEEEESNDNDEEEEMEVEEDEIDPDELSYEELMELGEFIGEETRGLSANEISLYLNPYTYHCAERKIGIDRCVICQVEYEDGEALVALQCEHAYHADCISKWLQIKKVCPICSNEVSTPNMASNT